MRLVLTKLAPPAAAVSLLCAALIAVACGPLTGAAPEPRLVRVLLEDATNLRLFETSSDLAAGEMLAQQIKLPEDSELIVESWKENTILLIAPEGDQTHIRALDVAAPETSPRLLYTWTSGGPTESITDARFLDDGQSQAFITASVSKSEVSATNSILHVVSLADPAQHARYVLNPGDSPLYAGFSFLAATPDSRKVFFDETGRDGDQAWSDWFEVDRQRNLVRKLEGLPPREKAIEQPTEAAFSPDGTKFAYIDYSKVPEIEELDFVDFVGDTRPDGCLKAIGNYDDEGGTISTTSFDGGAVTEVYRELSYAGNLCQIAARQIRYIEWLSATSIVFQTFDGLFTLDLPTGTKTDLYLFPGGRDGAPGVARRPRPTDVALPYVIMSDGTLIHTESRKALQFYHDKTGGPGPSMAEHFLLVR